MKKETKYICSKCYLKGYGLGVCKCKKKKPKIYNVFDTKPVFNKDGTITLIPAKKGYRIVITETMGEKLIIPIKFYYEKVKKK